MWWWNSWQPFQANTAKPNPPSTQPPRQSLKPGARKLEAVFRKEVNLGLLALQDTSKQEQGGKEPAAPCSTRLPTLFQSQGTAAQK